MGKASYHQLTVFSTEDIYGKIENYQQPESRFLAKSQRGSLLAKSEG